MTTDHTNDETPEAPPAIEGDWYWVTDPDSGHDLPAKRGPNGWWRLASGLHTQLCKVGPRIDPPGQPTELPPLPDGWEARRDVRGAPSTEYVQKDGMRVECYDDGDVIVTDDRPRYTTITELHAVLAHHLGLTAPVADVRALEAAESQLRDATESLGFVTAAREAARDYARAVLAAHGITYTDKGGAAVKRREWRTTPEGGRESVITEDAIAWEEQVGPSPEALAQAREQLRAERLNYTDHWLVDERATVIEMRRQLAEKERDDAADAAAAQKDHDEIERLQAELATERQRAEAAAKEDSERRLAAVKRYDEVVDVLAAAERREVAAIERAEAAERERSILSGRWDEALRRLEASKEALAASEAKRKALREACEAFVDGWKDEDAADGNLDGPRVHNVDMLVAALDADGKDTL